MNQRTEERRLTFKEWYDSLTEAQWLDIARRASERQLASIGGCLHSYKFETFMNLGDGRGNQRKYRCMRCLEVKWVPE